MHRRPKALVLLEDGTIFYGKSIGIEGTSFGEVCFNTGMTGYQEVFTDPSYFGQIMVTTNAHIGNYGVYPGESQSDRIMISGLVCKNFSFPYSRASSTESLFAYLKKHNIVTVSDVDTRALVSYIRDNGAMNVAITTVNIDQLDALRKQLARQPKMEGLELASKVSTKEPYFFGDPYAPYRVAVIDLGIKTNMLRKLSDLGIYLQVFPYDISFEQISQWKPDGFLFSNGPGDPKPLVSVQKLAKIVIGKGLPCLGICLGHQVMAIASEVKTFKMFNGHRGINHPIMNLKTGRGEITSQNHGFAVDRNSVEKHSNLTITHQHLNDGTVGGLSYGSEFCFSVQFHPEASPGPNDSDYLFKDFFEKISRFKLRSAG
ncbi:MAG: glutamine-hydrolyzing carbamoyl-phosphate synthase small subunit [Flavobacteriaceae bacterium]|nr:glutamine-hydrolyzing carbamoyl-phosphate synthase small subunit [Flavobacteriaceae bacterium]